MLSKIDSPHTVNSRPKEIYVKKIRVVIPHFFFFPREIHPSIVLSRTSRAERINWRASLRREGKKRQRHSSRDLDTNATWQTGYIFPVGGRILHPGEARASNVARRFFRDVPRILNVGCQYREGVCPWRKQFRTDFRPPWREYPQCNGMGFESVAVFHNTGNGW